MAGSRRKSEFCKSLTSDCWSVGEGVYEMRLHFGPGWRIYYCQAAIGVYRLIGGGTKDTQQNDVKIAKRNKRLLETEDART